MESLFLVSLAPAVPSRCRPAPDGSVGRQGSIPCPQGQAGPGCGCADHGGPNECEGPERGPHQWCGTKFSCHRADSASGVLSEGIRQALLHAGLCGRGAWRFPKRLLVGLIVALSMKGLRRKVYHYIF